jgi:nucleoside-diphosphate-sugar epimerase
MIGPTFRAALTEGDLALAITGARSWLGQALLAALTAEGLLPRRLRLFGSTPGHLLCGERQTPIEPLKAAPPLESGPWLLLHFAFLGKERTADLAPASFIAANNAILHDALRVAEGASELRMVFSSSGAVYGEQRRLIERPEANPYGWCKVAHEQAIMAWCRARGVPLVMPRIFNIGGPCVNKQQSYALSAMLLSAHREGIIRIAARRPVFRSYIHVAELNDLLCETALRQPPGEVLQFDTAGRETVEMADLAASVAASLQPRSVQITREAPPYGEVDWYVGDGCRYRGLLASLGQQIIGLERIIADTAATVYG